MQALQLYPDPADIVEVEIGNRFLLEMLKEIEFLQVEHFAFGDVKEVFNDSMI